MTKRRPPRAKPRSPSEFPGRPAKPETAPAAHHVPSSAAIRETIESIVVAFILAFLFRTFEAEAFVIPTGSMAPTLMGRHKDVVCRKCGCPYQVSASEEVDQDGTPRGELHQVVSGTCPMCRYTASLAKDDAYNGDRILVGKLSYDVSPPKRWDVIVFKYPGDADTHFHSGGAATNFIKRLVGLPGETIRIRDGDVWVRRPEDKALGDAGFAIARKLPEKLLAMLQPVFDNDYMPEIAKCGWPARWYCDSPAAGAWTSEGYATFRSDDAAAGENWLRYHHLTPTDWQGDDSQAARAARPTPQLIMDFIAYDTGSPPNFSDPTRPNSHWVGDLAAACTVEVEKPGGELALELRKGGRDFQCRFDLATGRATLSISGHDRERWRPTAMTSLRGTGRHDVMFSNCDDELRLWVDGRVVAFDSSTAYEDLGNSQHSTAADLAPVGVATKKAAVRISHLRVLRDTYYVAAREGYNQLTSEPYLDFSLESKPSEPERFFVLGDNSPRSKDGRLWGKEHYVSRDLLIGKALFIYWPHSWHRIPGTSVPFPYFPNFSRMGLVR